ncbi:hypothetical protein PsYK624_067680 [Phanerochaete sordida]|uniref:Uncharacterized protein n=1 Tax=Phanerochaete sordida TaxID=48140 RepID=A0A9P3LDJ4_9APHY|nr:hypothetical protein PsYK624_067680 [Phanerochaete sordida]
MANDSNTSDKDRGAMSNMSDLSSDEPLDLASTNPSARPERLAAPGNPPAALNLRQLASEPALSWGLFFLAGSAILRYAPRRPGVWRRRGLLGVYCGVECAAEYAYDAYDARVRDAYYAAEDSPRRQMWRRLAFVMEVPHAAASVRSILTEAWRDRCDDETLSKAHDVVALAVARVRERVGLAQRLYWSALSSGASRRAWIFTAMVSRRMNKDALEEIAPTGDSEAQELLFLMPAYLATLEHYDRWQTVSTTAHLAIVVAAVAGFARNTLVLRLSLAGGVASLAALIACGVIHRTMVHTADSFKDVELLNSALAVVLKDPRALGLLLPRYELEERLKKL